VGDVADCPLQGKGVRYPGAGSTHFYHLKMTPNIIKDINMKTCIYYEPVLGFKYRSDVRRFWDSDDGMSERILDIL